MLFGDLRLGSFMRSGSQVILQGVHIRWKSRNPTEDDSQKHGDPKRDGVQRPAGNTNDKVDVGNQVRYAIGVAQQSSPIVCNIGILDVRNVCPKNIERHEAKVDR